MKKTEIKVTGETKVKVPLEWEEKEAVAKRAQKAVEGIGIREGQELTPAAEVLVTEDTVTDK